MPVEHLAFGLDAFGLDDRMRLFSHLAADNRFEYLWVLRAFDFARANYRVQLATDDVVAELADLSATQSECPDPADVDLPARLDALVGWGLLHRGQDATKAATLAEYRRRHAVYQFTEAGYRAHRAVESVLTASIEDVGLSKLVFADLLADLSALAEANRAGDIEEVFRKFHRLDRALADIAERAARFYAMLSDLGRTNDTRPEVFLQHKDALITHLREFHDELQRYSPRLRAGVAEVEATGVDRLVEAAAEADDRPFRTPAERLDDWHRRWQGLRDWLGAPSAGGSEAERLAQATVGAISDVLTLLRRVTEARRGGVSRESQLRHLAAWFMAVPDVEAAHALFAATFAIEGGRHVSVAYDDPESISTRRSWWEAPAVELSRTLVQTGREPGSRNDRPAKLERDAAKRRRLRQEQLAAEQRLATAASGLAAGDGGVVLDEPQTAVLLRLLQAALTTRVAGRAVPLSATAHGVRLTLAPSPGAVQTVVTKTGTLHIDGHRLTVSGATR